ncbi:dimethyladenosine transferase [Nitrosococcus oceani ATCC 19707]|uniref:Ribosomal RNA small subunit methyltransferase A n=2 Tax=Nitrosococcus oceani TaxID=1229 RepID=RSMA_NITOC|nr:16S rRNA (adenine(1518)-N(6)/adenine(1519)-N(6))-dimethyltransferase RsmA [Nitrosococcus oceani]Q3JAF3.1 RecName: Full=Ribosomal RNA small subunit methyltransferase A; AltName: Full=16S rRNA (adenine(1518)-N(6)/adenine(1519)-N(6))-dimethyltransferase; AltName: Full=16S rRNA dimethyladenosine transferase; AltName: Full=16S rRNA dimethylase; AltName: Full=S-adenosylmethionine-6-N', N'-adenosyl(rRNA) dimethyltransferase [Nitrosococcus oceani ATCC 19707]KFI19306.1 ribosomal RNA small subunit methy
MNTLGHRARKRFGQHFLHDKGVIERLLRAINPQLNDLMVEIGPGQGALTLPLLHCLGHLEAIELDRDLAAYLVERCASEGNLRLHNVDSLTFDFRTLAHENRRLRVVGNLPYNISTPLLFHLLGQIGILEDMHFMLQREVVTRLAAKPGGKDYGRLSVMVQFYCEVEPLFTVKSGAFVPPPKVDSMVVRLIPHRPSLAPNISHGALNRVVSQAFSQRRKTLANALKGLLSSAELIALGIDPRQRPETISLEDYLALTRYWLKAQ